MPAVDPSRNAVVEDPFKEVVLNSLQTAVLDPLLWNIASARAASKSVHQEYENRSIEIQTNQY